MLRCKFKEIVIKYIEFNTFFKPFYYTYIRLTKYDAIYSLIFLSMEFAEAEKGYISIAFL